MRTISVLLPVLAVACGSETEIGNNVPEYPPSDYVPLEPVTQVDRILQVTTPKVDVLWTIDNSCSMADEQDALAENFPRFIDYFLGSGLDYHIGVTSTDIDRANGNGTDGKLRYAEDYGINYIETNTPLPLDVFSQMARMGTSGSANEKGIGATYKALELRRDTTNQNFYRDEASIHTVVITDERDQTPGSLITLAEFQGWYDDLKDSRDDRTFSSIVGMAGSERGTAYLDTTAKIGGITWDIGDPDWNEVLERLGIQASGLRREYFLSQRPVPGTIEVSVITHPEGAEIAFRETTIDPSSGEPVLDPDDDLDRIFTYNGQRNSIEFLTYVPQPLSVVLLEYTLLSSVHVQEEGT